MLRDITIGQYYPAKSPIHKLDPRVKLFGTLIYIIALFTFKGVLGLAIITAWLLTVIGISKVPISYIVKGLRAIVVIVCITCLFNVLFTPGTITVAKFGPCTISDTGIKNGVLMVFRLVFLIMGTSLMTLTTTPNELTDGLERSMRHLAKIKFPVHAIAMMMSIALRFIPILIDETDKIMKAQMARGADFESGGIIKRAKAMVPLLVPLFVSAFRRADDLAMAMEARCYNGGEGRTKMNPLRYHKNDAIAYLIIFAFLALVIAARIVWPMITALIGVSFL